MVNYCKDIAEFRALMEQSKEKLVVIDFTATWCPPCRMIAPEFDKLAEKNPDVIFVKIDVDDANDVASERGVTCMPTFQFFKNGEMVVKIEGANLAAITQKVQEFK